MRESFTRQLYISFTLLILSIFSASSANIGLPEVYYYKNSEYGASNKNWQITQSEKGILFFANVDGLLSFDGTRWKLHSMTRELSLRSVKVIGDRIYVGSFSDIGYFEYDKTNQLEYHSLMKSPELDKLGNVWNILEYRGRIFFQGENGVAIYLNNKLDKLLPTESRFTGMQLFNEKLYIIEKDYGLCEFKDNGLVHVLGGDLLRNKPLGTVIPFGNRHLVIGTHEHGLYIYDGTELKKWECEASSTLAEANIFSGANYFGESMVFGTIQNGLYVIDSLGRIKNHVSKDMGLTNSTVLTTFIDREGNIWCGLDRGIAKIQYNSNITYLTSFFDIGTGYDMCRVDDNNYFATNQAVYQITNSKLLDPLKKKTDFKKLKGSEGQSWSIYKDQDDILVAHNHGVMLIDDDVVKRITPDDVNGVWGFKSIPEHSDKLIAGCYDGMILLEKIDGSWHYKSRIEGFEESARDFEWDNGHTLFVSHMHKGVFRLILNEELDRVIQIDTLPYISFEGNKRELSIFKHGGKIYFAGTNGLYFYDQETKRPQLTTLFTSIFPSGEFPTSYKTDSYGDVWFFYPHSLGVLRKLEDNSYKKISAPFLCLNNKLVQTFQSVFVFEQGGAFFNIDDGFARYFPRNSSERKNNLELFISSFKSLSDTVQYSMFMNTEGTSAQSDIPHFPYSYNSFMVEFSALSFNDMSLEYSTFLSNIDNDTTEWSSGTTRNFINLHEGSYRFSVKARSGYLIESKILNFNFVVDPPWYRSSLAKVIYLLLIVLFAYLCFKIIKKYANQIQLKTTNRERERFRLKEQQFMHEALVVEKELIRLRNDKLTSEMHYKEKELASLAIHVVQKRDFLSELKEQLLRITRVKEPTEFGRKIVNLIKKIDQDIENESHWDAFERTFELVHETFLIQLKEKHPNLSLREQKLCAFIRMGMSSKEIGSLMNISTRAVENNRYKLRQNLGLQPSDHLADYICHL